MSGADIAPVRPLVLQDLRVFDNDDPRVHDLRVAERLGFERPRDIRQLIQAQSG